MQKAMTSQNLTIKDCSMGQKRVARSTAALDIRRKRQSSFSGHVSHDPRTHEQGGTLTLHEKPQLIPTALDSANREERGLQTRRKTRRRSRSSVFVFTAGLFCPGRRIFAARIGCDSPKFMPCAWHVTQPARSTEGDGAPGGGGGEGVSCAGRRPRPLTTLPQDSRSRDGPDRV